VTALDVDRWGCREGRLHLLDERCQFPIEGIPPLGALPARIRSTS